MYNIKLEKGKRIENLKTVRENILSGYKAGITYEKRAILIIRVSKALPLRDDKNRLHVLRKEGGRGHVSSGDRVDTSIRRIEDFMKREERKTNYCNINNSMIYRAAITRKQKLKNSICIDISSDKQPKSHMRRI